MKGLPKKNRHYVWVALGVCGLRSLGWAETVEQTPPWKAPESEIKQIDDVSVYACQVWSQAAKHISSLRFGGCTRLYKTEARSDPLLLKVSSIRIVFRWIGDQGASY